MDFVAADAEGYEPSNEVVGWARAAAEANGTAVELTNDPREAATEADVLYTDVWTSMGQEEERERRLADLEGFGIDAELVALASERAIVLPASPHYGRRSRRTFSTASARPSGTRRRTASTPRRRSWRSSSASGFRGSRPGGAGLAAREAPRGHVQRGDRRRGREPRGARPLRPLPRHPPHRARRGELRRRAPGQDRDLPDPLEEEFGDDPELLEEEIRVTVVHEIAHHFGIDEDRLSELGWG